MYQINKPEEGCVVFATKHHPKLMNGARIGVCEEMYDGVLVVRDGDKIYVVCIVYKGPRFHDFWRDGDSPNNPSPRLVDDIISQDFDGKNSEFAKHHRVNAETSNQWRRGSWIVYDSVLYSPQYRHQKWVEKQNLDVLVTFEDLIWLKYSGDARQFMEENGYTVNIVQTWIKCGWIIYDGLMYSPRRFFE